MAAKHPFVQNNYFGFNPTGLERGPKVKNAVIFPVVRVVREQKQSGLSGSWIDPDHVFTYVAEGQAHFILEKKRHTLKSGDALIMPPGLKHVILCGPGESLTQFVIHFDLFPRLGPTQKLISKRLFPDAPVVRLEPHERETLKTGFRRLQILFQNREAWWGLEAGALVTQLIALVLASRDRQGLRQPAGRDPEKNGQGSWVGGPVLHPEGWKRLGPALDLVHRDVSDPGLTVARAARSVGVSPSHFALLFKSKMKIPFHQYLRELRIRRAQGHLGDPAVTIAEAARGAGFSDVQAFSKAFRKLCHLPPAAWRKTIPLKSSV